MGIGIFLLLVALLALAGFYGGVETGAYTLSRLRLTMLVSREDSRARAVHRILEKPSDVIAMTLIGQNLCIFLATALLTETLRARLPSHTELYATLILAPVIYVFCDAAPKNLFARGADVLFYRLIAPIRVSGVLFYPAVVMVRFISRFWQAALGGKPESANAFFLTPAYLTYLLSESKSIGHLSDYQTTLAFNIMKLSKLSVDHAMIPLDRVASFPRTLAPSEVLTAARGFPFTRFPVYEGEPANIVGVVNVIDLALGADAGGGPDAHVRPLVAVPHTATVLDVLQLMRERSALLAAVTRDGRPMGIVTFKDLVEEIAGELGEW
ncbi:MAG: CNNM domain-containing protein [Planctomycetota bacterium]